MLEEIIISDKVKELFNDAEEALKDKFKEIDSLETSNSIKVLNAFKKYKVSTTHNARSLFVILYKIYH